MTASLTLLKISRYIQRQFYVLVCDLYALGGAF
jgi:hypothetical protein